MAVYGISKEGADALKQLATDMSALNNDIQECGKKLTTKSAVLAKAWAFMRNKFLNSLPVSTRHRKRVVNL